MAYRSAVDIPRTSDVPFFSTLHGRERRALRGIERIDLQAAVLHGTKKKGWPHPVTGAARLKYTHAGIVYITDESSTVEITSYAVPIKIPRADLKPTHVREHEAAKRRLRIDPSLCTSHTVIVVDQSASMKTCDIFDFRNRSMAVFGMLALDFVAKQRVSGEGTDTDVVSLVVMRDEGEVVFEREPMGLVLYNRFVGLHDESTPRSHGNFLPALDEAERLLQTQAHGGCALSLLFLSDGRPSDQHTTMFSDGSSTYDEVVDVIADRVRGLAEVYGQQLSIATLGFASPGQDFAVLEAMAGAARDAGSQGVFHRPELSSKGLGTAIAHSVSSLTATRLRLTTLAAQDREPREVRKVEREAADRIWSHSSTAVQTWTDWALYTDGVQRIDFSYTALNASGYPWVPVPHFSEEANGIAISKKILGEGAERMVFGLQEFSSRTGQLVGPKLVAKESRHVGQEKLKVGFHETFTKTQLQAKRLAVTFNQRVRERMTVLDLPTSKVWEVSFLDCSVYEFQQYMEGWEPFTRGVLVEKLLEPASRYTKWNGNNGYVHHAPSSKTSFPVGNGGSRPLDTARPIREIQASSSSFAPTAECYPQAFSHFSFFETQRRKLVCDLQGVLSSSATGEDRAGVFELTDPVIHYRSTTGRRQVYGRTDLGRKGIDIFFETHRCNDVCNLLGIGGVVP